MTTSTSTRILATLALGVGLIAVAGPAAADTPAPKVTTDGSTHTLKVLGHQTKMLTNGAPMTGQSMATPRPGDKWEFADDLKQDGVKVGSDSVQCTVAAVDKLSCVATETFGNGSLTIKGTAPMGMNDNTAFDVPIVSGTGAYDGATGTFHLVNVPGTNGVDSNLTFTYTTTSSRAATSATTKSDTAKSDTAKSDTAKSDTAKSDTAKKADTAKPSTQVTKVPAGGAETGGGSTAGMEHGWMLGLGALAAAAGAGTLALGRRGR